MQSWSSSTITTSLTQTICTCPYNSCFDTLAFGGLSYVAWFATVLKAFALASRSVVEWILRLGLTPLLAPRIRVGVDVDPGITAAGLICVDCHVVAPTFHVCCVQSDKLWIFLPSEIIDSIKPAYCPALFKVSPWPDINPSSIFRTFCVKLPVVFAETIFHRGCSDIKLSLLGRQIFRQFSRCSFKTYCRVFSCNICLF